MFLTGRRLLFASLALVLCGCGEDTESKRAAEIQKSASDVEQIASAVSSGVGKVGRTQAKGSGAAFVVMEELHNSRAGQIQHAIMMVRLHDKYGLKDIGLEGYLKSRPEINVSWFANSHPKMTQTDRARVAVRLLTEGEISAAEFMAMVYDDVKVHPIEDAADYNVVLRDGASRAMFGLAQRCDANRAEQISDRWERAAKEKKPMTAEEQLATAEGLERCRTEKDIRLTAGDSQNWESWLSFWRGRAGGSKTMVAAATKAATDRGAGVIVMNIGAAHTDGVDKMIGESGHPFATLTPFVIANGDEAGDLQGGFDRKYHKLSVFSSGALAITLSQNFGRSRGGKKPEPNLVTADGTPEQWLEAKGEMYSITAYIAGSLVGGGPPPPSVPGQPPSGVPPGSGQPPYGFGGDDFKKHLIYVDPRSIERVAPKDGKPGYVVFPIVLNPDDSKKKRTVWVAAAPGQGPERNIVAVEEMLLRAFDEVHAQKDAPVSTEDSKGVIQMTPGVMAAVSPNKEAALRALLKAV